MGSSLLMAGEQTFGDEYCLVAKTDPYGFSPAVVPSDDLIVVNEQDGDILIMAIKVTHKPMLMANLNRDTTIYLSSIGGYGGAPMSMTGVSDPYAV